MKRHSRGRSRFQSPASHLNLREGPRNLYQELSLLGANRHNSPEWLGHDWNNNGNHSFLPEGMLNTHPSTRPCRFNGVENRPVDGRYSQQPFCGAPSNSGGRPQPQKRHWPSSNKYTGPYHPPNQHSDRRAYSWHHRHQNGHHRHQNPVALPQPSNPSAKGRNERADNHLGSTSTVRSPMQHLTGMITSLITTFENSETMSSPHSLQNGDYMSDKSCDYPLVVQEEESIESSGLACSYLTSLTSHILDSKRSAAKERLGEGAAWLSVNDFEGEIERAYTATISEEFKLVLPVSQDSEIEDYCGQNSRTADYAKLLTQEFERDQRGVNGMHQTADKGDYFSLGGKTFFEDDENEQTCSEDGSEVFDKNCVNENRAGEVIGEYDEDVETGEKAEGTEDKPGSDSVHVPIEVHCFSGAEEDNVFTSGKGRQTGQPTPMSSECIFPAIAESSIRDTAVNEDAEASPSNVSSLNGSPRLRIKEEKMDVDEHGMRCDCDQNGNAERNEGNDVPAGDIVVKTEAREECSVMPCTKSSETITCLPRMAEEECMTTRVAVTDSGYLQDLPAAGIRHGIGVGDNGGGGGAGDQGRTQISTDVCQFSELDSSSRGEPAGRNGELTGENGEPTADNGEPTGGNGEPTGGNGVPAEGNGEPPAAGNGDLAGGNGDLAGGNGDLAGGNGEPTWGNGEPAGGNGELPAAGNGEPTGEKGEPTGGNGSLDSVNATADPKLIERSDSTQTDRRSSSEYYDDGSDGEGMCGANGEPAGENGQPTEGNGQPTEGNGQPTGGNGQPTGGKGEPTGGNGSLDSVNATADPKLIERSDSTQTDRRSSSEYYDDGSDSEGMCADFESDSSVITVSPGPVDEEYVQNLLNEANLLNPKPFKFKFDEDMQERSRENSEGSKQNQEKKEMFKHEDGATGLEGLSLSTRTCQRAERFVDGEDKRFVEHRTSRNKLQEEPLILKYTLISSDEEQDETEREDNSKCVVNRERKDNSEHKDNCECEDNREEESSENFSICSANIAEDSVRKKDDCGSGCQSEDEFRLRSLCTTDETGSSTCSSRSSTSTLCPDRDDASTRSFPSESCRSFPSDDVDCGHELGYQSSDPSVVEPLKITLSIKTDPNTGQSNWNVMERAKRAKRRNNVEDATVKSRINGFCSPKKIQKITRSKQKSRMKIQNKHTVVRNVMSLTQLASKPVEDYIRTRTAELAYKNSNNKVWSESEMNDRLRNATSSNTKKDDGVIRLASADVMYEIMKDIPAKSQLKKCRTSPRNMFLAAKQGNVAQLMVQAADCNVNCTIPQENFKTAMHAAAATGHLPSLRLLWMVGGDLSVLDSKLRSPLFDAVENDQIAIVQFLISKKVDLNSKDSTGITILHLAAKKCGVEIINLLMETRALNIDEQDSGGWTALMWTAEGKLVQAAKCLLNWGASVHILDNESNSCLHWAALSGSTEITKLFLDANVNIDGTNMFGGTALHIAARERKLHVIQLLADYKPNLEIRDAEYKKALQLVPLRSKCYNYLETMGKLCVIEKKSRRYRLVTSDISKGHESRPIPCINEVDDENLPRDFVYIHTSCEGRNISFNRIAMLGCNCPDSCANQKSCECAQLSSRKRFWYDKTGLISPDIFSEDRPVVYECNMKCKCWITCSQRVVQHGTKAQLQLYKTKDKGWAVRILKAIPKGSFVCEYIGEILTDSEADTRNDDCYLFDLDVKGRSKLLCLDAKFYGNISRFINHSCDPNVLAVRVFTDHQIKCCPRIAFFASREIKAYEEICSDYGERFWKVKKSEFHCVCKSPKCKYKAPNPSKKSLGQ